MIQELITVFLIGVGLGIWLTWLYLRRRFDGFMNVLEYDDKKVMSLVLNDDPEILENKRTVIFKVVHESPGLRAENTGYNEKPI